AQGGLPLAYTPLVLVGMNIVYALAAYPCGQWADRWPVSYLLLPGVALLLAADLVLASSVTTGSLALGIALWGLHMAMTQGLLAALVAKTAPEDLRGTAYGMFYLCSGLAMLLASGLAGWLWDSLGAPSTFLAGAGFCLLSLVLMQHPGLRRLMAQPA
ncbi:MAG: MFS transporter, partial [Burkholderiaceae bacterium]|nr:MFS transporter [Burkholderiaceae bacterium]